MAEIENKEQEKTYISDSDTSGYVQGVGQESGIDLGGLFSNKFTNIMPLYTSQKGATQLYTASKYGKRFVLKGLKENYRNDPILNLAMAKEFEIGIALEHPNIRRTISLENVDGLGQVIVLEYIDGRSLESMLQKEEIDHEMGRSICRQVAEALNYLHGREAMHRDLKPANILVSFQGGIVKLIDFNLADNNEFIILKNPAGSGKYIAPELLETDSHPTPEADIYSLGVVAGEIAEASDDGYLASISEKCRSSSMPRRAAGFKLLLGGLNHGSPKMLVTDFLSSAWLAYALLAICSLLAAFILSHNLINH